MAGKITRIRERYSSESELRAQVTLTLGTSFRFHEEVPGVHPNGRNLRLDAVLEPHDPRGWKDARPALGVEFKMPPDNFDTRNFTRWAAQAVDYTYVNWRGFGRLPIFTCPSPITRLGKHDGARLVTRLLGQLGVGELVRLEEYGWTLLMNEHRLWSETEGVKEASRWRLAPKEGSR